MEYVSEVRGELELKISKNHLIVGSIILMPGVILIDVFDLLAPGVGSVSSGVVLIIAGLYRAVKIETEIRCIYSYLITHFYYNREEFK